MPPPLSAEPPSPRRVLVAGASSLLGRALVTELQGRAHTVRALARRPWPAPDGVEVHLGDVTRPESLDGCCEGVDVVISAIGAPVRPTWLRPEQTFQQVDTQGNLSLLDEARKTGVRRFVYVSVFGEYPPGVRYVEAHEAVVEALRTSGMPHTVVRPTGFHSALFMLVDLARYGLGAVLGDGSARTNPIADEDLARVCADAVDTDATEIAAGGPEILTRRRIGELAFEAVERRPRLVPVPAAMARLQASLVRPLNPRLGDVLSFFAHVTTHDGVAPAVGTTPLLTSFRRHAGLPALPADPPPPSSSETSAR